MTSMHDAYRRELDDLSFSDEAKARMAAHLAATADGSETGKVLRMPEHTAAASAPEREARCSRALPRLHARSILARAAIVGGLGLALACGGTLAYAEGNPLVALGYAYDLFTGTPANTEVVQRVGMPIGASATSDGVRVTVEAIYGDRYNYEVVYKIEREDGKAFEGIHTLKGGLLDAMIDDGGSLSIDGIMSAHGGSYFYDADPTDNAIQFVQQLSVATDDTGSIIGRTARAHLSGLSVVPTDGNKAQLSSGTWDFKFKINYADESRELDEFTSKKLALGSNAVRMSMVNVSPLGLTVRYDVDDTVEPSGKGGKLSDADEVELASVSGLPMSVTFTDGSVCDLSGTGYTSHGNGDGTTTVQKGGMFDRIVSMDDIASVTIAGETVNLR